jgi:hypothetical protein
VRQLLANATIAASREKDYPVWGSIFSTASVGDCQGVDQ